ncbi:MAG: hypothetical protein K0S09_1497 [Sphingobacteriaceae bacterium]|jgi:hypothetical protein|nr:hypothetical protein [Sphingobacteriaceae bacterium]
MEKGAIFPLFYLPSVEYFTQLIRHKDDILLEKFEHFPKQTYRNRATIQSPNGKLDLIVPVIKGSKNHTKVKDVRISYDFRWQRLHWMSLQTSYRSSAYFEFYEDDLAPFYEKKWEFLFDYNEELFTLLLKFLKLNITYGYTDEYQPAANYSLDFRDSIHPKQPPHGSVKPYFQVFEHQTGFLPNLSVIDLLFSQGPQSISYL